MINWTGFVPAAVVVSLIPGASQVLGLRNAVRYGRRVAVAGLGGRLAAFLVLIGAATVGLGAILAASAAALRVIKWVGFGYLAWIGVSTLWHARSTYPDSSGPLAATPAGTRAAVTNEFLVALTNPKALLLFAALLPQFVDGTADGAGLGLALLGLAYLVVEFVVGFGYIAVGSRLGATGFRARTQRRVDVGAGVVFLVLAGLIGFGSAS